MDCEQNSNDRKENELFKLPDLFPLLTDNVEIISRKRGSSEIDLFEKNEDFKTEIISENSSDNELFEQNEDYKYDFISEDSNDNKLFEPKHLKSDGVVTLQGILDAKNSKYELFQLNDDFKSDIIPENSKNYTQFAKDIMTIEMPYFLKFANSNNSCYANSLIQAILALGEKLFEIVNNFIFLLQFN